MTMGQMLLIFLAVVAILTGIGLWQYKRRGKTADPKKNVTENIADLNDRFNRARYMDQDGK